MCAAICLIFVHIWNAIAVVLHIVGFPTDSCIAGIGKWFSSLSSAIASCCSRNLNEPTLLPTNYPDLIVENQSNAGGTGGRGIFSSNNNSSSSNTNNNNNSSNRGRTLGGRDLSTMATKSSSQSPDNNNRGVYSPLTQEA